MAGRIRPEDILAVKERATIEDIVREHVTLRRAGAGLKGLCPFHDEKTPSFTVNPTTGRYHCYGCQEGGDVIEFVSKVENLTFTEALERLAAKVGVELRYEDSSGMPGGRRDDAPSAGRRARLVEANRVAQQFYAAALLAPGDARAGRDFLRERGFDGAAAKHFGVGFSPRNGDELLRHMRTKGFTEDELVTVGLAGRGQRGLYARFRGRLVWPIRSTGSEVLGFGARRIFADDGIEAKYLNTSETPLYKKTTVLYGLDLARKAISQQRQAVVVEGYTDVMACHLAGVETAVASCGTAFGVEHIKTLRRLMRDEPDLDPARVIFTFDGDKAGQAAAMKAFKEDQRWASQSFVAVEASGKDPCELRQAGGDLAVRALIEDAVPMFDFAVRTTIARFDLDTAEGRVAAIRAAAPIVAEIRDQSLRPEYTRRVAGLVGVEVEQVAAEARRAAASPASSSAPTSRERPPAERVYADPDESMVEPSADELAAALPKPDLRDPVAQVERQLLQCLLQYPGAFAPEAIEALTPESFTAPAYQLAYAAVRATGLPANGRSTASWHTALAEHTAAAARPVLNELSVASIPVVLDPGTGEPSLRYVDSLLLRVQEVSLGREIADALGRLRRWDAADSGHGGDADPEARRALGVRLQELQRRLVELRAQEDR